MSEEYYKKIFAFNLKYLMETNGKSQIDLINDLPFDKSTVSTWVNGTRLPRMDKIAIIAKYFNVPRSYLTEEHSSDQSEPSVLKLTKEEIQLVHAYRQADPGIQASVCKLLDIKGDSSSEMAELFIS